MVRLLDRMPKCHLVFSLFSFASFFVLNTVVFASCLILVINDLTPMPHVPSLYNATCPFCPSEVKIFLHFYLSLSYIHT
uniref:Uncharacterized protein n=1 Tax=Octopus bimaculoides TaxID=37653 RepID=A0A0L8GLJ9_OCTBM